MSIFPFMESDEEVIEQIEKQEELPIFTEYAYDFINNCLITGADNKNIILEKNDALKIWIYKVLRTERYRYINYSDDHGTEFDELIGTGMRFDILILEIQRCITEALLVNPYIVGVSDFSFDQVDTQLQVHFRVSTIYDDMMIDDDVKGVEING